MKIIGFKIWYKDGSIYRGDNWEELPSEDVQVIMCYYDEYYAEGKRYRKTMDGCDWYWFTEGDLYGERAIDGPTVPKPNNIPDNIIKQGTWARTEDEFNLLCDSAIKELDY